MNNFATIILVWLAFFGGAMAGAVAVWQLIDRSEREQALNQGLNQGRKHDRKHDLGQNIAERISIDFFKGLR